MRNLTRRLETLECARNIAVKTPLRVIVGGCFGVPDLASSTCRRTRSSDGQLIEYVRLEGCTDEISEEELETWISSFPIETSSQRRAGK